MVLLVFCDPCVKMGSGITQIRDTKWDMAKKIKIKNKIDQRSTQNDPTSF